MSISRNRSSTTLPTDIGNKTITGNLIHPSPPSPTGLRQRLSSALLGSKGSMLTPSASSTDLHALSAKGKDQDFKQENPVARLKLLLVSPLYLICTTSVLATVYTTGPLRAQPSTLPYFHIGKQSYHILLTHVRLTDCFLPGPALPEPLYDPNARRLACAL